MQRTYQYRLYPTREQGDHLETLLCQARLLYNEALAHRRDVYKQTTHSVSYVDQWERFKNDRKGRLEDFGLLNATSVQQLLRRLDKTFAAFFRRYKAGETPGFPRFKGANRFRSLEYRHGDGCKLRADKLYIQHIGEVSVRLHRPVPEGCLKHVVLTRKAGGRWFVSFQGDDGQCPAPLKSGVDVGIDKGINALLALSTGELINNPRWLRRSLTKLRVTQRSLARKVRGSTRYLQQARNVARLHEKIHHQRKDFWHRLTYKLTQTYALVAVEELNLAFLTQNKHLSLSAHDAGLGLFQAMLDYKAERAGCAVVAIDPRNTSQMCSGCGQITKKPLKVRWHSCACGTELDRDINAAKNILTKARCGPTGDNVGVVESSVVRQSRSP